MNFITFSAATTNIFPAANDIANGQLVTEWNLRAREMVATDSAIQYQVGPSFVHSELDFEVGLLTDSGGGYVNNYTLSIAEGRGVINGHYIETLVPMTIDLVEANIKLQAQARQALKGTLAIGFRTFYATEPTVAGTILVNNEESMYIGIQTVILPASEFITPSESPTDPNLVTADIRLATFTFLNNKVTNIKNCPEKIQYISPERMTKIEELVSSKYVTKTGLNSKKLYAFAGKGTDPETGYDTWEDVTDSMVVWDADPQRTPALTSYKEAKFVDAADSIYFVMPHKQVEGMTDDEGNPEYYAPKILQFPTASYAENTPGIVNADYTKQIKNLSSKIDDFRSTLTGKQIYYMDVREPEEDLPQINDGWAIGDYILVKNDNYYMGDSSDTQSSPATMYVVLPGKVESIKFVVSEDGDSTLAADFPDNFSGVELGYLEWNFSAGQSVPETVDPAFYPKFFSSEDNVRGVPGDASTDEWVDYFRLRYYKEENEENTHPYTDYYYAVATAGKHEWSDAVIVTGSVAFATESTIGGFLNASEDATDYGYVYLDDTGHLKLLDYELLRSGTLAYQIASDLTIPSGTLDEVQMYLDEYVNERIAFPAITRLSTLPSIINIYLNLEEDEEGGSIEIHGIDSRFNTAVMLHVQGTAGGNITINIRDCQKLIIDDEIEGDPIINIFRTNLYYDPIVFQYIKTCYRSTDIYGDYTGFRDLSIWYEQLDSEDPNLLVNGMTVSEIDAQIISTDINYWKELGTSANDNNYLVALKSITFSGEGDIVGCEVLTANNSTDNVDPGEKIIVGNFVLPQGSSLIYPIACLTRVLKVTGDFTSAYLSDGNWYVTDNSFSLATGVYDPTSIETAMTGTVAFHSNTTLIPSTISQTSISVWEPDSYHIFRGGAIS